MFLNRGKFKVSLLSLESKIEFCSGDEFFLARNCIGSLRNAQLTSNGKLHIKQNFVLLCEDNLLFI